MLADALAWPVSLPLNPAAEVDVTTEQLRNLSAAEGVPTQALSTWPLAGAANFHLCTSTGLARVAEILLARHGLPRQGARLR